MTKELPPPGLLRKLLRYEPETGKLFWRERTPDMFRSERRGPEHSCKIWNTRFSNKEAFTSIDAHGYNQGKILCKLYRLHRVAWALHRGSWPKAEIDHINGNKSDNRIVNLRDVSRSTNMRNAKMRSHNTSGHNGVGWYAHTGKWNAEITFDGKTKKLGQFTKIIDAVNARRDAEFGLGFTDRHGSKD